jgi:hypothetical protein
MKKLLIIFLIISGCKKEPLIDAIKDGAKLTKADAGIYVGIWWSEDCQDSLVINCSMVKNDSVYYESNMPQFNNDLTHVNGYKQPDDNLVLGGIVWRYEH